MIELRLERVGHFNKGESGDRSGLEEVFTHGGVKGLEAFGVIGECDGVDNAVECAVVGCDLFSQCGNLLGELNVTNVGLSIAQQFL